MWVKLDNNYLLQDIPNHINWCKLRFEKFGIPKGGHKSQPMYSIWYKKENEVLSRRIVDLNSGELKIYTLRAAKRKGLRI